MLTPAREDASVGVATSQKDWGTEDSAYPKHRGRWREGKGRWVRRLQAGRVTVTAAISAYGGLRHAPPTTLPLPHPSARAGCQPALRNTQLLERWLSGSIPGNHMGGPQPSVTRSGLQAYLQAEHCTHTIDKKKRKETPSHFPRRHRRVPVLALRLWCHVRG